MRRLRRGLVATMLAGGLVVYVTTCRSVASGYPRMRAWQLPGDGWLLFYRTNEGFWGIRDARYYRFAEWVRPDGSRRVFVIAQEGINKMRKVEAWYSPERRTVFLVDPFVLRASIDLTTGRCDRFRTGGYFGHARIRYVSSPTLPTDRRPLLEVAESDVRVPVPRGALAGARRQAKKDLADLTAAARERLVRGMSYSEVEAVLGPPWTSRAEGRIPSDEEGIGTYQWWTGEWALERSLWVEFFNLGVSRVFVRGGGRARALELASNAAVATD